MIEEINGFKSILEQKPKEGKMCSVFIKIENQTYHGYIFKTQDKECRAAFHHHSDNSIIYAGNCAYWAYASEEYCKELQKQPLFKNKTVVESNGDKKRNERICRRRSTEISSRVC